MKAPGPVVFFGTPEFAVPTLEALCSAGAPPARVVSQPARARGRGRRLSESPVAKRGRELGLEVEAVDDVNDEAFLSGLRGIEPWIAVVVAFGQIFRASLLDLPQCGCINLHASLLPKFRGAAPMQAAIAAGEESTGVTTMVMDAGLDTGPVLLQERVEIGAEETWPELAARLAVAGADLVVRTLEGLASGLLEARPQQHEGASYAPMLSRDDARIGWELSAGELFNRWRAFVPWPGLSSELNGEPVKIRACRPESGGHDGRRPGEIVRADSALVVACGEGTLLRLEELQRPGRRAQAAVDFVNGEHLAVGDCFDESRPLG